tara:strand:+ start:1310 stop:4072 length:2763 start_codon:yes stop_codon:yes gene_type:complete
MGEIIKPIQEAVQKVVSWFIDIPEVPDLPQVEEIRGTLVNKQSNNAQIPVVYGERLLGGTRVFVETSGTDNTYLYMALVLCEGEINAITEIQVNDDAVTFSGSFANGTEITSNDSKYGTTVKAQPFYGTDGQSASSLLSTLTNWGSNHKLSGICYVAFRFEWDSDKYTGIPNIKVKVQGKKISTFDGSSNETTGQYSTNPAFVLLDFLRNERYGKGIPLTEIDIPSFYAASQIADTTVTYYTGTTGKLFECNAVLNTNKKILDNVKTLLRGMRGLMPYVQGNYKLIIESTGTAAFTLNEDNIIGGIKVESERKDQKYNRVLVNYVNPEKNYQADTIVYDTDHETLKTADGGFLQEGNVTLDTINSPYQAHEFGKIILQRSRNNLKLGLNANYESLDLAIGDIVNVTSTILGMTNKPFRVSGMTLNSNFTTSLSLQEHQDDWYTFTTIAEQDIIGDTNFPDPFTIEAPSIEHSDELISLFDGSVVSKLTVEVNSNDQFVNEYEVQIKPQSDTNFITIGRSTNKVFEKYPVIEGEIYDIRARAINSLGVSSTYTTSQHEVNSAFLPPDNVTNYSVDVVGDKVHHNWSPVTNLDLRFYEIRMSTDTTKTNYADTVVLVERIGRPSTSVVTPYQAGVKYFIKAVDKFGIRSTNFASAIVTEQVFEEKQTSIQTITEEPTFAGTKSNCVVVDSKLRLDTALFDSISGNFDDGNGFFDGGAGTIVSSGTYDFNTAIDLGAKFKSNVHLKDFIVQNINFINNFDSKQGLFDSAEGLFDGGENASVDTNVELQVALSDDNVTFGSFQSFKSGDFNTRALKFRAVLTSNNAEETPEISNMSLILSLQKRSEEGSNISSGTDTAGKTITYSYPFFQIPTLTVIAQDLQTGDFFNINSKSKTAFNIEFFNSGGNTVNRTFDYQLIGIGQQQ